MSILSNYKIKFHNSIYDSTVYKNPESINVALSSILFDNSSPGDVEPIINGINLVLNGTLPTADELSKGLTYFIITPTITKIYLDCK